MSKDLMYRDEIQQLVSDVYRGLDEAPGDAGTDYYTEEQIAALPPEAREWSFAVGNPVPWAGLQAGEVVADLGCGAGIDVLLAAQEVGPHGRAIGVDFLAEMLERARRFAEQAGLDNAEFHQAEMEDLPLADGSADVVVSNGAINLSARKSRVMAEAHRILRPGGRVSVADLIIREEELPAEVLTHPSAWAG